MEEFINMAEEVTSIRSFSEFIEWFSYISFEMKVVVSFAIIGVLVLLYVFIKAIFVDKDYYTR